ncbi:hypothetical protein [Xanthomonas massiliensis]|uniref:hypothetical protein n=1 Tax=Xanthomonas massiliensis TaxID=1720302 RepID=UPI000824E322|nr:hypothetical protein [Xanthomonas massiliensis]
MAWCIWSRIACSTSRADFYKEDISFYKEDINMGDNGKKTPAKIGTLVYPFKKKAESGKVGAQPVGADDTRFYFQALSNASDGFYPIGANGQWHGGIHFDAQTGATLPQEEGIRCIGDGEVVAYQVESQYSSVEYSTGKALYSRGFTLVRHRLELPPAPATKQQGQKEQNKTAPASDHTPQRPDQKAEEPSLIFYSVYLHLLDWAGYQKLDAKKPRPGYWGDEIYLVGDKAFDQDRTRNAFIPEDSGPGINLRTAENQYAGFAPRGVKLKLGEENPRKKGYFKIVEVVSGTTYPGDVTGTYVFKGSSKSKEGLTPVGAEPTKDTVHVLPKPKPIKAGELIGYLGQYERYIDTNPMVSARPRSLTQLDVFTPDDIKGFIAKSRERAKQLDAKQKVLLKVDKGAKLALPTKADQRIAAQDAVVAVGTPKASSGWIQVRRGTLEIAERSALGTFDSATNSYPGGKIPYRFVGAQDSDAITQAAYNALGKDAKAAYTRRQVWVPTGTPVWVEAGMLDSEGTASGREMQAWSQFPLKVGQGDGPTANFVRVVAIKQLSKVVAEPDGTRWWEIDIGTADGSSRIGWVREKDHPLVTLCSPWDWPGFEIVEGDTSTPEQLYARHIDATKQARPDEQAALAAKAAEANGGPLFSRLCDAIDLDDDKVLTSEELRKALKQPWLADALSRLIIHHTSEWGTPAEQWNAIDKDIPELRKVDWDKEKERIQALQWWSQVKTDPALPVDAKVYAFHPIGIIVNFLNISDSLKELIRRIGDIISHGEGGYESYNSGTKGVANNAVGHSFLHPPAGTVTGKTINQILETDSLSGTDSNRMFATGKYQTVISTLRTAKEKMGLTGKEKYDNDMQERVFAEYLLDKAGGGALGRFVKEGTGTIDDAQYAAAKEWASIAAPSGKSIKNGQISDGTLSYYESAANSANSVSTKNLREILQEIQSHRP